MSSSIPKVSSAVPILQMYYMITLELIPHLFLPAISCFLFTVYSLQYIFIFLFVAENAASNDFIIILPVARCDGFSWWNIVAHISEVRGDNCYNWLYLTTCWRCTSLQNGHGVFSSQANWFHACRLILENCFHSQQSKVAFQTITKQLDYSASQMCPRHKTKSVDHFVFATNSQHKFIVTMIFS